MWKEIKDENVRMIWKCEETDCEEGNPEVDVSPTFYQDNGTPVCGCDCDMAYQRTEINQTKMKKIRRKCVECGEWFEQEIIDYGDKKLTTDDYDEYCEACNQKAMR